MPDFFNAMTALIIAINVFGAYVLIKWKFPTRLGHSEEKFVSRKLRNLDPTRYKILVDVMLPSRGNTTATQIDHIVISNYGIFVIETKSHKGWIFGSADHEHWTQVIYRYKGRFYNPLRQNFAHTKAVEDLLGKPHFKKSIVSLVAFPNADKLKISGTDSVGHARDIVRKIESYIKPVFSDAERDGIYDLLVTSNILDKEARKMHIREVRDLNIFTR
jgi:hypothetical protein